MNNNIEDMPKTSMIDQEQIKMISGSIKKHSADLEKIKNKADLIWERCETYLDNNIINSIDTVKEINRKRYNVAIEELNNYANKIETIANIWRETEEQIKTSSVKLETLFSDISKSLSNIANNNSQN